MQAWAGRTCWEAVAAAGQAWGGAGGGAAVAGVKEGRCLYVSSLPMEYSQEEEEKRSICLSNTVCY